MQSTWYFTHIFLLVRQCAEHITQLPRFKVKGQGQRTVSPEPFDRFLWNFNHIFLLTNSVQSNDPASNAQGHRWRSKDLPLNFVSAPYLLNPLINFHVTSLICSCAEHMTKLPRLWVKVTGQGQRIYPWISGPLHISWTLFINFHDTSLICSS